MNAVTQPSRRRFLKTSALVGGGLVIGFVVPGAERFALGRTRTAAAAAGFAPNAFLRIGNDDSVTVLIAHSEMGQGIWTALPMLIAEELDADWSKIRVEHAPAAPAYAHTGVRHADDRRLDVAPGRSSSATASAGAAARALLVQAAAQRFNVPARAGAHRERRSRSPATSARATARSPTTPASCTAPDPATLTLKDPKDWKIIGKPTKRLDTPEKITGRAQFGMDVQFAGPADRAWSRARRCSAAR